MCSNSTVDSEMLNYIFEFVYSRLVAESFQFYRILPEGSPLDVSDCPDFRTLIFFRSHAFEQHSTYCKCDSLAKIEVSVYPRIVLSSTVEY